MTYAELEKMFISQEAGQISHKIVVFYVQKDKTCL